MSEHTATPWELGDVQHTSWGYQQQVVGPDGEEVCWVDCVEGDAANAEFIVRACNAHAGLVKACKAAKAELHCCAGQALARGHGNAGIARVINQLSAALAAVGE